MKGSSKNDSAEKKRLLPEMIFTLCNYTKWLGHLHVVCCKKVEYLNISHLELWMSKHTCEVWFDECSRLCVRNCKSSDGCSCNRAKGCMKGCWVNIYSKPLKHVWEHLIYHGFFLHFADKLIRADWCWGMLATSQFRIFYLLISYLEM